MSKISLKEKILAIFNSKSLIEENAILKSQLAYGYQVLSNIEETVKLAEENNVPKEEIYKEIKRQITISYNGALSGEISDVETEKTQKFRENLKNTIESKNKTLNKI